jgi:murein DD-endopeptidase MepM/ murein hydrolase activator NlpD
VFPVQPAGLAGYGASHHDYPATDLFAPAGTDVVATTSGVVDYTSARDRWDPQADDPATRGGISVAIIGDDGIRYYGSHLRDLAAGIEPGTRVEAGRMLGHVGQTGNARGTAAHLHFGISHPTTPEDWQTRRGEVSPYRILNAWRSGIDRTPLVPGARAPACRPA